MQYRDALHPRLWFAASVLLALTVPNTSSADCSSIGDQEQRALCRARSKRSTSECSVIREHDLRTYCYATAGSNKDVGACNAIHDPDQRALCRGQTRKSATECAAIHDRDIRIYCRAVSAENSSACSPIRNTGTRKRCFAETYSPPPWNIENAECTQPETADPVACPPAQ